MIRFPLVGSPSAKSMTRWANRRTSAISPVSCLAASAASDSPTVSVGSPIDSSSAVCSVASRDASRRCALANCAITCPVMPIASDRLSPAAVHSSRSSSKPVSAPLPPTRHALPRTAGCAARCASRPGRGRRRGAGRRPAGPCANSSVRRRCRGWSTRFRRACASRTPRADRRRPPDARRSVPHSRRPTPGHGLRSRRPGADAAARDRISAATRRPPRGSTDAETHTPRGGVKRT